MGCCRKNELEEQMLMNLQKKTWTAGLTLRLGGTPFSPLPFPHAFHALSMPSFVSPYLGSSPQPAAMKIGKALRGRSHSRYYSHVCLYLTAAVVQRKYVTTTDACTRHCKPCQSQGLFLPAVWAAFPNFSTPRVWSLTCTHMLLLLLLNGFG